MKTVRIHPAAGLRGRRGFIVFVGALALLSAVLSSCGARTGSSAAGSPSSPSMVSPSVTATHTSPTPPVTPASWQRISHAPISGVRYGPPTEAVWDGSEMLLVSSVQAPGGSCNEIGAAYDPAKDTWRTLPRLRNVPGCFDPISTDMAVWTGKELLLWGETNAAFNPTTDRWRELPDPPTGFGGPSVAVWTGHQMIGWGGGGGDLALGDGAAYTPATNSWSMLPLAPLAGAGRHTTDAGIASGPNGGHVYVAATSRSEAGSYRAFVMAYRA